MSSQNFLEYDLVKDGQSLLTFRSMIYVDSNFEAKVTSQPVEEGAFTSVNKVVNPKSFTVQVSLVGSEQEIGQALKILDQELLEPSLLQIISPLGATPEASLTKISYKQSVENGRGALWVNLSFEEIKQVVSSFTVTTANIKPISSNQAKNKGDVSTTDSGKQQTKEPRQSVLSKVL